jgi:hypothetical protein
MAGNNTATDNTDVVLDRTFTVPLNPNEARLFLLEKNNWLKIIPGAENGTITTNIDTNDAWTLDTNSGDTYTFVNTKVSSNEDVGALKMEYTVQIKSSVVLSIAMNISVDVKYNFVEASASSTSGGCDIQRTLSNLHIGGWYGFLIVGFLKPTVEKVGSQENDSMQELMNAAALLK